MKVINEYPGSHHYETGYTKEENLWCPCCGKQELWTEDGEGDYYAGSQSICIACESVCYLNDCGGIIHHDNLKGVLNQLRTGLTATPTTRRSN